MFGRVVALVVLVALTGRCATSVEVDYESPGTVSNTLPPIVPKDVSMDLQDSDTLSRIEPHDVFLALQDSGTLAPIEPKDVPLLLQESDTQSPIEPKDAAPKCQFPVPVVFVPAGGSVTFCTPRSFLPKKCGWQFTTVPGSTLNLHCSKFNLKKDKFLIYSALNCQPFPYNFPTNMALNAQTAWVFFQNSLRIRRAEISCTMTASELTAAPPPISCRCGIVNRTPRIVGGNNTQVNEYPWQVGLLDGETRSVFCGGSIISNRYIATAAHCMPGRTISSFKLLLGGHTKDSPITTEKIVSPIRIIDHPQYQDGNSNNNDISIIEIEPLDFTDPNEVSRPICLPDSCDTYAGVTATTTGWGLLSSGGAQPDILQEVDVPVVTNAVCTSVYGSKITGNMICAGTAGKDSCQNDSGGPLIAPDGANYELIGVVSFGIGCGLPNTPGVYARVTALQSWIQSTTAGSTTCGR